MLDFIFLWSARNEEHLDKHDVAPEEAKYVVEHAEAPYPEKTGDEKRIVWGRTQTNRFLQIVYVDVLIKDVRFDEYERLRFYERVALDDGEPAVRVIHARDLTENEKRRLGRRKRGRL